MAGFPYIFTFYSFKGGVGRSMALLNTAYALAGWGKHVLMVDMDLEAPGISSFLEANRELTAPDGPHPLDILTLLNEAIHAATAGESSSEIANKLPPLTNYLRQVKREALAPLTPRYGSLGRLDIVAADTQRDWCRRLAELGLQGLPQDRLVQISRALHLYFKQHRFPQRRLGIEDFEPAEETPYDYILVDSRTGITEIGGLCVGPLADRLVVLCGLNEQNVDGTLMFLREAGIEPKSRAADATPWDEVDQPAEREAPSLGPKPTILIASPVPNGEISSKRERLGKLEERIGIRPHRLSYHPQMALLEGIFVRDYKDEYLAGEYLAVANTLTRHVGDHPAQLTARSVQLLRDKEKQAEAIDLILRGAAQQPETGGALLIQHANLFNPASESEHMIGRRLHAAIAANPQLRDQALVNWGNVLQAHALSKDGADADRLFAAANVKYAQALKLNPDMHDALNNWGNALQAQAERKTGAEADHLFGEASAKYAEALRLKPDDADVLSNWGNGLQAQAKRKGGAEADHLFAEAGAKYAEALKLKPDKHDALYNWGNAVAAQAKRKNGAEADRLFAEAGAKYAEALKLKPDKHEASFNWGAALQAQAESKSGAEADRLFAEAGAKYEEALKLKPDKHEASFNWGAALQAQAESKSGAEADRLFAEAGAKYEEALKLKPDKYEALSNWGNALQAQAKNKTGDEAERLFAEADAKYAKALTLKPDHHETLNNWAAALAVKSRTKHGEEAVRLLEEARQKLLAAESFKPGSGAFNLACVEALLSNGEEAIRWLKLCGEAGDHLTSKGITNDADFDAIRENPDFRAFLLTLSEGE